MVSVCCIFSFFFISFSFSSFHCRDENDQRVVYVRDSAAVVKRTREREKGVWGEIDQLT